MDTEYVWKGYCKESRTEFMETHWPFVSIMTRVAVLAMPTKECDLPPERITELLHKFGRIMACMCEIIDDDQDEIAQLKALAGCKKPSEGGVN